MATIEMEKIEMVLPKDILFAMREANNSGKIQKKLTIALAIYLFQERSISLGKAVELAGTSRVKFMEILKNHGFPAYEYRTNRFGFQDKRQIF